MRSKKNWSPVSELSPLIETTLSDLLEFTRDGEWGEGAPAAGLVRMRVVRGTDFARVRLGDLTTLPIRYIRKDVAARKALLAGDLLIETAGGTKDQPTGRTVLISQRTIDKADAPLIPASFARFLRPRPALIDPAFLFWKLQAEYNSGKLSSYHVQHTGVARFQFTQFASTHLLEIPGNKETQREAARTLSALDDKIEMNRRMNETLEAMAQAIFRDWFVDFGPVRRKLAGETDPVAIMGGLTPDPARAAELAALFPHKLSENGLPDGWVPSTLGQLFDVRIGKTPPRKESEHFLAGDRGVPWCSIRDMASGDLFLSSTSESLRAESVDRCRVNRVSEGVVILSFKLTVGRVAITDRAMTTNEAIAHLNSTAASPSAWFTYSHLRQFDFDTLGSTSSIATAVNSKTIKQIPILLPSPAIANAFDELSEPLFARVRSSLSENRTLAEARDYLLPRLMSGAVRVADALAIEPTQ